MDINTITKIREVMAKLTQVPGVEYYIHNWSAYEEDIERVKGAIPHLPEVFTEFETVLGFYIREYLTDPIAQPGFGTHNLEMMSRGAKIISGHCDNIARRYHLLIRQIENGVFAGRQGVGAQKAIQMMGEETANFLIGTNIQGHLFRLGDRVEVCFDAGVDLAGFVSLCIGDTLGTNLRITACQHCGKPFITGGRAIYCQRNEGGGSCRAVGAVSKYQKTLTENPGVAAYRRAYKKYYARVVKDAMGQDEFSAWKRKARKHLKSYENGSLSLEQLEKFLGA